MLIRKSIEISDDDDDDDDDGGVDDGKCVARRFSYNNSFPHLFHYSFKRAQDGLFWFIEGNCEWKFL